MTKVDHNNLQRANHRRSKMLKPREPDGFYDFDTCTATKLHITRQMALRVNHALDLCWTEPLILQEATTSRYGDRNRENLRFLPPHFKQNLILKYKQSTSGFNRVELPWCRRLAKIWLEKKNKFCSP